MKKPFPAQRTSHRAAAHGWFLAFGHHGAVWTPRPTFGACAKMRPQELCGRLFPEPQQHLVLEVCSEWLNRPGPMGSLQNASMRTGVAKINSVLRRRWCFLGLLITVSLPAAWSSASAVEVPAGFVADQTGPLRAQPENIAAA